MSGHSSDADGASSYDAFVRYVNSSSVPGEEAAPNGSAGSAARVVASSAVPINLDVEAGEEKAAVHGAATRRSTSASAYSSRRSNGVLRTASTTEERSNPFSAREGNALIWSNVNMTLVSKRQICNVRFSVNRRWSNIRHSDLYAGKSYLCCTQSQCPS